MVSPDELKVLTESEYMMYYYAGIGFASGCVAGYGFALRTALKASNEMIRFYKSELLSVKTRVKELEERLYPNVIDRRLHPRDED